MNLLLSLSSECTILIVQNESKMKIKTALFILILLSSLHIKAQETPTISPSAIFTTVDGETSEAVTEFSGSAPLKAKFSANVANQGDWNAYYEWRFTLEGDEKPYLIRYEQDTEVTFTKAGSHRVVLYAIFTHGTDSVKYTEEYWADASPITVSISESKLEMPNAFSPNGDGINDIYKAKDGWQSLTEFKAYIFNRWGQKLFEWTNPADGWDGKFQGKDVKQGVYFCLVKAKGADGRTFNIKTDVNLLRGYNEDGGTKMGK